MRVLAPIDSSRHSQSAIDVLMGMRWEVGTEIQLVTVLHPGEQPGEGAPAGLDFGSSLEDCQKAMSAISQELQRALRECHVSFAVFQGDAKTRILAVAEEFGADLIVMGSSGARKLERILHGSVSQAVLSQSECPVLIAKAEGYTHELDLQAGFKNVLLAVDNSPQAKAAMHWLANFHWPKTTQFRLITVIDSLSSRFMMETNTARAAGLAQDHENLFMAARNNVSDLGVELTQILSTDNVSIEVGEGDACECIVSAAEKISADLIVIGSHGRTGFSKLLQGSVSQAVSVKAPCPVAVVRGLLPKSHGINQKTGVFKIGNLSKLRAEHVRFSGEVGEQTTHIMPPGIGG